MTDHFALFGIPRILHIDPEKLEGRFHTLQRASHPDHFAGGSVKELLRAQDTSAAINDAYRTLRDPLRRLRYILKLYGYSVESGKAVPQSLLMAVMEAQETIGELEFSKPGPEHEQLLEKIESLLQHFAGREIELETERQELAARWDAFPKHPAEREALSEDERTILEAVAKLLAERSYIETLRSSLVAAERGEFAAIKH
jgi:molecular chaperone HscB